MIFGPAVHRSSPAGAVVDGARDGARIWPLPPQQLLTLVAVPPNGRPQIPPRAIVHAQEADLRLPPLPSFSSWIIIPKFKHKHHHQHRFCIFICYSCCFRQSSRQRLASGLWLSWLPCLLTFSTASLCRHRPPQ